jgi:hypothetical protein
MTDPTPRACFFGSPETGSWQIRSRQLATARAQWSSREGLGPDDIEGNEVFCAVKRPYRARMRMLRALGRVVIYDALDCWRQPDDDARLDDLDKIRRHFADWFGELHADGVIFPDRAMLDDLGDLAPDPVCIYHHFWPGLAPIEVRPRARLVGYQGDPRYLGPWRARIDRACKRLGLRFVVNPDDLRSIDIGVAVRGGVHSSLLARRYKSNVKLANFYGAAIPCAVDAEGLSYRETADGEVRFFATGEELEARLAELLPHDTRMQAHRSFLRTREQFTLGAIADRYEAYFRGALARRSQAGVQNARALLTTRSSADTAR